MFRIISFNILNRYIIIITVIISIGIYSLILNYWLPGYSLIKLITISSFVSTFIIFLINTSFFSRGIWRLFSFFNESLFPDLNGAWEGEITFDSNSRLNARAVIRQTLLHTQIDMHTPTSKSITLESTPITEGGQPKLYYVHRVTPQNPDWHVYTGSTIFDIRKIIVNGKSTLELSGYYYTDRKTNGRVRLKQINEKENTDVSFY